MKDAYKSETAIQREICDWLNDIGAFFWRSNNIPVFGRALPKYTPKGLPDIFIVRKGLIVAMEVKRARPEGAREPNGRAVRQGMLSPDQAEFGLKLENSGGKYFCVRSLQDAKNAILLIDESNINFLIERPKH